MRGEAGRAGAGRAGASLGVWLVTGPSAADITSRVRRTIKDLAGRAVRQARPRSAEDVERREDGRMSPRALTDEQRDRAAGVLLGAAIGDALGVPWEFESAKDEAVEATPCGRGGYGPGEYSDDTQMAVCIALVAATGADLRSAEALDAIAAAFIAWSRLPLPDIGILTSAVLGAAGGLERPPAERCTEAAFRHYESARRSFSNGALMRTAPVALSALFGRDGEEARLVTAEAARAVASLTHADPRAGDASVLWTEAIRLAVETGELDVAAGLDLIPESRDGGGDVEQPAEPRRWWADAIDEAQRVGWSGYRNARNGSALVSLQTAWAAIVSTSAVDDGDSGQAHVVRALQAAVHAGNDTDTVAAIAGGLLGARYGLAGMPAEWRRQINGWPGGEDGGAYYDTRGAARRAAAFRASDLVRLSLLTALEGEASSEDEAVWRRVAAEDGPLPEVAG